jgi:hypothetical protein
MGRWNICGQNNVARVHDGDEEMTPMVNADSGAAVARDQDAKILVEHQRLPTSGARGVKPFVIDGTQYLAVPQLSQDMADTPAHMNGGDSDIPALIYRWTGGRFEKDGEFPLPGGEDIDVFHLGTDDFMITAAIRTGHGPYDYNVDQTLYRRSTAGWQPFQTFPGFAAKQWHFFRIGDRAFLALAQGVTLGHIEARNPRQSRIFEWDGARFTDFQTLDGQWGYNWQHFELGGDHFLCYADHVGASGVWKWDGTSFVPYQMIAETGGRCFRVFEAENATFLAFANIQGDTTLHRWDGTRFALHQTLSGPGGRELCVVRSGPELFLVQVNFITGAPSAPRTDQMSRIYRWIDRRMELVEEFPTFGGTEAATFEQDGNLYLAISNSLTTDVRFRQDSIIYRFNA